MREEDETTQRQWEHLNYWEGRDLAGKFPVVLESGLQPKLVGETSQTARDLYFLIVLAHTTARCLAGMQLSGFE